jgi:hypothetical protein
LSFLPSTSFSFTLQTFSTSQTSSYLKNFTCSSTLSNLVLNNNNWYSFSFSA